MPGVRQVNAHLVRPARCDVYREQRVVASALEHNGHTVRRLAALGGGLHRTEQRVRHRTDRRIDHEHLRPSRAERQRSIGFPDGAVAPRARELRGGAASAGEQYQT